MDKIIIGNSLSDYIEGLDYDTRRKREGFLFAKNNGCSQEAVNELERALTRACLKFNLAKAELQKLLLKEIKSQKINWSLNYKTCEVSYEAE